MEYIENLSKTINYIENNLTNKLTIEDISRFSGYSKFHFQRLFHQVVGETVGQYIMNRRLAEAATLLVNDSMSILQIALQLGYESHEVFTRAFNKRYKMSPYQFRQTGVTTEFIYKNPIDVQYLTNKNNNILGDIEEVMLEELRLTGYMASNTSHEEIYASWSKLRRDIDIYDKRDMYVYGVLHYPESFGLEIDFKYIAAVEKAEIVQLPNQELKEVILPKNNYLIFTHQGLAKELPLSYEYIYGVWLPKSKYLANGLFDFERYRSFEEGTKQTIQICIPITSK
ncbi:AraC family transcriptional regulator [Cytobacillus sp. IB215665]|uniref:AraC family transcriptional regulator n=1 Tax=Cytobacillus sp. IB215665 TaxID=3097357 RepID=UPI002A0B8633|nr:AraC family transcriptional regulator [Cytobacillus sp. IB215665]MDX8366099.1 AraC family transcriptional regulator [Cytobacillus sp. IB215665]